jgi:hypothetical protein
MSLFRRHPKGKAAPMHNPTPPAPDIVAPPSPPRFDPDMLAFGWARRSVNTRYRDGGFYRPSRSGGERRVRASQIRDELAAFAAERGWDATTPSGRLDALERDAQEWIIRLTPASEPDTATGSGQPVDRTLPPPSWAQRGENDSLPDPALGTAVAEVFVAETAYDGPGRTLIHFWGHFRTWDGAQWVSVPDVDMRAALETFGEGQHYWRDTGVGEVLTPWTGVEAGHMAALQRLTHWDAGAFPSTPRAVAERDHRRAESPAPTVTYAHFT